MHPAHSRRSLYLRVTLLGVAQIVSWGTLFYAIGVLGEPMRLGLGVSEVLLFGAFSAGMLLSGALAPAIGRDIDRHGGRRALCIGSLVGALSMAVLALAQGPWSMIAGWLLAGAASAATLYDAAFAALHVLAGRSFRRAVTVLTLLGGFASTVFWPLSRYVLEVAGWREAFALYALVHLALCLPVHAYCLPARRGPVGPATARDAASAAPASAAAASAKAGAAAPDARVFAWLAVALSLVSFVAVAVSAHLMTMLTAGGVGARDAVLIGSLIGPMQVAGRLVEFGLARDVRATTTGSFALALMAIALLIFTQVRGTWIVALAFVIAYGWANGVFTIARGTVPRALFGSEGYGAVLGRLARPQFVARALAPLATSLVLALDASKRAAPWALAAFALVALFAYGRALALAARVRAAPAMGRAGPSAASAEAAPQPADQHAREPEP